MVNFWIKGLPPYLQLALIDRLIVSFHDECMCVCCWTLRPLERVLWSMRPCKVNHLFLVPACPCVLCQTRIHFWKYHNRHRVINYMSFWLHRHVHVKGSFYAWFLVLMTSYIKYQNQLPPPPPPPPCILYKPSIGRETEYLICVA